MAEPHIRIVIRKISTQMAGDTQTEIDAMTDVCKKFPGDEWVLLNTHFVGLEPGPTVDIMFIFVKAEYHPPARAEYYLDRIGENLAALHATLLDVGVCVSTEIDEATDEVEVPEEIEEAAE